MQGCGEIRLPGTDRGCRGRRARPRPPAPGDKPAPGARLRRARTLLRAGEAPVPAAAGHSQGSLGSCRHLTSAQTQPSPAGRWTRPRASPGGREPAAEVSAAAGPGRTLRRAGLSREGSGEGAPGRGPRGGTRHRLRERGCSRASPRRRGAGRKESAVLARGEPVPPPALPALPGRGRHGAGRAGGAAGAQRGPGAGAAPAPHR